MQRFFSALATFVVVLVAEFFTLAAVEGFGGYRIFPFGSRKPLLVLMLAVSTGAAILRWRMLGESKEPAPRTGAAPQPSPSAPMTNASRPDLQAMAARASTGHDTRVPPAPASIQHRPQPDLIAAASRQAIVFRQHFPPRHDPGLRSFFGGAPVAPRGFAWPRSTDPKSKGQPMHFLLQVDCAAVPAAARLGALPDRGVLYFFLDLSWETFDGRVVHADAPDGDWQAVAPPDDLGPAHGKQAVYYCGWAQSVEQCPVLLPKWTFDPVVIELPEPVLDEEDDDGEPRPVLWPERAAAERLLEAQGDTERYDYLTIRDFADGSSLRRPFPTFPQDWRALQICGVSLAGRADRERQFPQVSPFRAMEKEDRDAALAAIAAEAQTWIDRAASMPAFEEVPREDRDAFWELLVRHASLSRYFLTEAVILSMEASLEHSVGAASRVPADLAHRIRGRHALAARVDSGIHATIPDRMLAPPVDVQGNQWERAQTHLLLLELSSSEGIGHHFGEGVFQFWIRPEDLVAGRFDKVELTSDAY